MVACERCSLKNNVVSLDTAVVILSTLLKLVNVDQENLKKEEANVSTEPIKKKGDFSNATTIGELPLDDEITTTVEIKEAPKTYETLFSELVKLQKVKIQENSN